MRVFIKGKPNWARTAIRDKKSVIVERKAYGYARGHSYDIENEKLVEEMIDREIAVPWKKDKHPIPKAEKQANIAKAKIAAKAAAKAKPGPKAK